ELPARSSRIRRPPPAARSGSSSNARSSRGTGRRFRSPPTPCASTATRRTPPRSRPRFGPPSSRQMSSCGASRAGGLRREGGQPSRGVLRQQKLELFPPESGQRAGVPGEDRVVQPLLRLLQLDDFLRRGPFTSTS